MQGLNMKLVFERGQHGDLDESSASQGEAGYGIYAYVPSAAMRAYYTARGENLFRLTHLDGEVVDFKGPLLAQLVRFVQDDIKATAQRMPGHKPSVVTARNVQRFGHRIEQFIRQHHPAAVAYIVPHEGPGIPTGRQAVIRQFDAFECEEVSCTAEPARGSRPRP